jgi:hypothetical protein
MITLFTGAVSMSMTKAVLEINKRNAEKKANELQEQARKKLRMARASLDMTSQVCTLINHCYTVCTLIHHRYC